MTQWKVPAELTPEEKKLVGRIRCKSKFYVFLREIRGELFDSEFQRELAEAYSPRGQDPVPPALLGMVTLLQAYTGVSDADAVDEAEMDRRWQLVLGTLGTEKAPFGQGSLPRFRARLIERNLDQRLLDRTVEIAKRTGAFGWQRLKAALDSSPLRGRGRVEDSWNLIGHAMGRLVGVLARLADVDVSEVIDGAGLTILQGSSVKASLDIDWDDEGQRRDAFQLVVEQGCNLLTWAHEHASEVMAHPEVKEAAELLDRVLKQDTEPDPDRPTKVRIRKGVAGDRICSVGDLEMRHGRKSCSKAFNGYKGYIGALVDVPLILSAEARPANGPEVESVSSLLAPVLQLGELDELLIDRGFLKHPMVGRLHRGGVKIRCRPWKMKNEGNFTKADFKIDLRRKLVTCPANKTVSYTKGRMTAYFGAECENCRLQTRCTSSANGRGIRIHEDEVLHRELRSQSRSARGRSALRDRVAVEHRLARIGATQTDRARYKGTRKNTFDLRRHAALANLIEIRTALAA